MTTAVANHHPSLLPRLNLVLASGAIVLAVVAIAADDVGSAPTTKPIPATTFVTVVGPAHPLGAPDVGIPCDQLVYTRC